MNNITMGMIGLLIYTIGIFGVLEFYSPCWHAFSFQNDHGDDYHCDGDYIGWNWRWMLSVVGCVFGLIMVLQGMEKEADGG